MNIDLTDKNLTHTEKEEIKKLLKREKQGLDDLEQMLHLIDLVWDDYGCDNKNPDWEKIGKFYSHPVWLLNGLFIEQHDVSMGQRHAISDWIIQNNIRNVADYGGGFGTLARLIAEKDINIRVDIYEPYPSDFGLKRASEFKNIRIVDKLGDDYDCLIATEVIEHLPDPLANFAEMIKSVKLNGYLIVANNFHPVVQCHLPQIFHFRYTFKQFAKMMRLEVIEVLKDNYATIFKKVEETELNWKKIRFYEKLSKMVFPIIEILKAILRPIKSVLNQRLVIK